MTIIDDKDFPKHLSKEEIEKWCIQNFLPSNYFDLPVQERRDAFKECQRKLWAIDGNSEYFEERLAIYRKSKGKEKK